MRKAEKAIERAKAILQKALDDIAKERDEAYRNYSDTGYQRYYNKMEAYDADIANLEGFIHSWQQIREAERESDKLRRTLSIYVRKLDEFEKEYPGDEYVKQIVSRCKSKLESAKMDAAMGKRA